MSSRSIVDRTLLFAAAVCAAGLTWQLTVLVVTKNHAPSFHRPESAPEAATQPLAQVPNTPAATTVRVVYPDGISAKTVGKATDVAQTADGPTPTPIALTASPQTPPPAPDTSGPATSSAVVVPASVDRASAGTPVPLADAVPAQAVDAIPAAPSGTVAGDAEPKAAHGGAININSASIEDLNHLQGAGRIGQAIARHRPYRSVEDLLTKRVVRRGVYEQIKNSIAAE